MKVGIASLCAYVGLLSFALAGLSVGEITAMAKAQSNRVIKLTDNNYQDLLSGARDYHLIVYLATDAPSINCALCKEFKPAFENVVQSWFHDHPNGLSAKELQANDESIPKKNVFFASADFMDSRGFFKVFELDNIPKVYHFPPTVSTNANNFVSEKREYMFYQGDHAQLLLNYLAETTGQRVNIYTPPDYSRIAINAFGAFTFVFTVRKFKNQILAGLTSRILWTGLSLFAVLLLTTGYMFNQIRGTPYVRELGKGKVEYIVPSQQQQLGVETQIVSFIYGLLSLFVIVLWKKLPSIKSPSVHFFAVMLFTGLIFVTYSAYLTIFGMKGTGYPYQFVKFF